MLYNVVKIDNYPQFLEKCNKTQVVSRSVIKCNRWVISCTIAVTPCT